MSDLYTRIKEAADHIRQRSAITPEFGLILGTGLGDLADRIEGSVSIPFGEIPHFVESTATSHQGNLVLGTVEGRAVCVMQGRVHFYEGYSMEEITLPVRVMRELGAEVLIVSNACGGMNHQHERGDILIIEDHISLFPDNPLRGENDERLGPRFPDMCAPYDRELLGLAEEAALAEAQERVKKDIDVLRTSR